MAVCRTPKATSTIHDHVSTFTQLPSWPSARLYTKALSLIAPKALNTTISASSTLPSRYNGPVWAQRPRVLHEIVSALSMCVARCAVIARVPCLLAGNGEEESRMRAPHGELCQKAGARAKRLFNGLFVV